MKSGDNRQLWGIVLAGGEGSRVQELLRQPCGGRGLKQFRAIFDHHSIPCDHHSML
ncbi:MAG: hypothetical protein AB7P18_21090 [Candidatus Binatia bacterium]